MAYQHTFAAATEPVTTWLDDNFNAAGRLGTIPCTVTGSNTLALTPYTSPTIPTPPFVLQALLRVSGVGDVTNTGAVTANVGGTGALPVYKDTPSGPAHLTGGEIVADNSFSLIFDQTLNGGASGWHLETAPANAAGTVTSVSTGTGLTGGPITTTGTISLASIANSRLQANISGGSAPPTANTLTAILDALIGSTEGSLITRGSSVWGASGETSWTPAIAFGGASTGVTYGTRVGQYLSIGLLTVAMFNFTLTSKGSESGTATISLPLTAGGTNRIGGGFISNYANLASVTSVPWAQIAASASTATLVVAGSGTVTALSEANLNNNSTLAGFLFYFAG